MRGRHATLVAIVAGCAPVMPATFAGALAFDRAATDPRAVVLADRVIAATGGADRWRDLHELRWVRRFEQGGAPAKFQEGGWDRVDGRAQARLPADGDDIVVTRELYGSGAAAYAIAQTKDKTRQPRAKPLHHSVEAAAIAESEERFPIDTAMLAMPAWLEAPGVQLAYVGTVADHEGQMREALDIAFVPADPVHTGLTFRVLVDPATYLLAQLDIATASGRRSYHVSGYVDRDGLKFPTKLDDVADTTDQISFDDVTVGEVGQVEYLPPKQ